MHQSTLEVPPLQRAAATPPGGPLIALHSRQQSPAVAEPIFDAAAPASRSDDLRRSLAACLAALRCRWQRQRSSGTVANCLHGLQIWKNSMDGRQAVRRMPSWREAPTWPYCSLMLVASAPKFDEARAGESLLFEPT